jgi:hypothetical protein
MFCHGLTHQLFISNSFNNNEHTTSLGSEFWMNPELCHASKPWLCHGRTEYGPPHVHPREKPPKSKQASGSASQGRHPLAGKMSSRSRPAPRSGPSASFLGIQFSAADEGRRILLLHYPHKPVTRGQLFSETGQTNFKGVAKAASRPCKVICLVSSVF